MVIELPIGGSFGLVTNNKKMSIKFKLTESFLNKYKKAKAPFGFNGLGELVYLRTYSRIKENGDNEQWWETVCRVVEGTYNIQKRWIDEHKLGWNAQKSQRSAQEMYERIFTMKFLPPGRGLWAMGSPVIEERGLYAALNNCLAGETQFFTKEKGLVKLADEVGNTLTVWTSQGWKSGKVNSHGEQYLDKISFKPTSRLAKGSKTQHRIEVYATANHGWLLANQERDYSLTEGKKVAASAPPSEEECKEGSVHGFVFADGSLAWSGKEHNRYFIRLCGEKAKRSGYFDDVTFPPFSNGDPVGRYNSSKDLKALPTGESPAYIASFLRAWCEFDGHDESFSFCLDTTLPGAVPFVTSYAPLIGKVVTGVSVETSPSNFGERAPLYRIKLRDAETTVFSVQDIQQNVRFEEVFCLDVPDVHDFTLAGGLHSLNCAYVGTEAIKEDQTKAFEFMMDMSMLGVGVGFDSEGAGKIDIKKPGSDTLNYIIPDTREGWVESLKLLLESYFSGGPRVTMDYSSIRPAGLPIKGFGGMSSGPGPLQEMHKSIADVLEPGIGSPISVRNIVDVMNLIGKCVVAGNIRRTAQIAFGKPTDLTYLDLKNYAVNPERATYGWTSNNTIFAELGMDYSAPAERTKINGEPGYAWLENMQNYSRMNNGPDRKDHRVRGGNPCLEQSLEPYELCCLVETFPDNHETLEDYRVTLKYAYLYAKTVTLGKTHWAETNRVLLRNRRIGCSMSGIAQFVAKRGLNTLKEWCTEGYSTLDYYDEIYSDWLAIPKSIKKTSIKPSGTVSLLAGATPGMHFPESRFYIRRVRLSIHSELPAILKEAGYNLEPCFGDDSSLVVEIPVDVGAGVRTVGEVSMWEQLSLAAFLQRYWSDNQVSCTVTFQPHEGNQIKEALNYFQYQLKGVSFLPQLEKGAYKQMPYEKIDEARYNEMFSNIKTLNFRKVRNEEAEVERFCNNDTCEIKPS